MVPTRAPRFAARASSRLVVSFTALLALTAPTSRAAAPPDSAAAGESPRYRLDPIVVTAERMPLALGRVPGDVTVIDGARLAGERPLAVAEALRSVPGVDVQRGGRLGKITDVRLRGADPRHTLVLYDGIPLNGPWVGSFDFADLGVAGASQIEVLGGPASTLYGSGAVGGVIQVLGGGPPGPGGVRGYAEVGGEVTWRQGASFRSQEDGRTITLALSRLATNGTGTRDAYRGWNAAARAEAALDGRTRIRLTGLLTHGAKELPYDYVFDTGDLRMHQVRDPNYEERDRILAGSALLTRAFGGENALEAEVSGLGGRIRNDNPANEPGGDYQDTRLDNTRWTGSLRARAALGPRVRIVAGGEVRGENVNRDDDSQFDGVQYPSSVDEAVHGRSLYAQAHLEPHDRVVIGAGLRVEDHARYGSYGVPRVSAALSVSELGIRLRGGYGRAFTAPTLTDLHYPGYGSPSLRPERSRTWEAGLDGRWLDGRVEAHATWHRTRFKDLIHSNSFFTADNIGRATIEGKEVSVRVRPAGSITIDGRAAHLPVATNAATGERLGKRPRWRTGAELDVRASRALHLLASWRWSDSFHDPFDFVDAGGRFRDGDTPGYAVLDLGAVVTPSRGPVAVRARLENAFDRGVEEVKGLPARGRSVTFGLDFRH